MEWNGREWNGMEYNEINQQKINEIPNNWRLNWKVWTLAIIKERHF